MQDFRNSRAKENQAEI